MSTYPTQVADHAAVCGPRHGMHNGRALLVLVLVGEAGRSLGSAFISPQSSRVLRPPQQRSLLCSMEGGGARQFLLGLPRADLQSLAKEHNIKANKKSADIIELLIECGVGASVLEHSGECSSAEMKHKSAPASSEEEENADKSNGAAALGAGVDLSSALSGLGTILVQPVEGDEELELPCASALFGSDASVSGRLNTQCFSPPHEASDGQKMEGEVALMQRGGGISFVAKALLAQEQRAVALVIANTEDTLLTPGDTTATLDGANVRIPVVLVSSLDGALLQHGSRVEVSRMRVDLIARDLEAIEEKRGRRDAGLELAAQSSVAGGGGSGADGTAQARGARHTGRGVGAGAGGGGRRRRPGSAPMVNLDGVSLKDMVTWLSLDLGWDEMARVTGIACFVNNPSINSSLKMLRKKDNSWARAKVEKLYRQNQQLRQL